MSLNKTETKIKANKNRIYSASLLFRQTKRYIYKKREKKDDERMMMMIMLMNK